MDKQKNRIRLLFWAGLFCGIGLLLLPSILRSWNRQKAENAMTTYLTMLDHMNEPEIRQAELCMEGYNEAIGQADQEGSLEKVYQVVQGEVLGILKIDAVQMELPIYMTTGERSLGQGACHVEGTAFPTEKGHTCCMLIGHSGLSYMKLFDDLCRVKVDDAVSVTVFHKIYRYRVSRIDTVTPDRLCEYMLPDSEKHSLRLVTCTPIGVNSHRLVVTAELISVEEG